MTISINDTYTTTGAQTEYDVGAPKLLTFAVTHTSGTVNVECKITPDGAWKVLQANAVSGTIYPVTTPIEDIRVNITTVGSTDVIFEVVGISR